ncbi:MAG: hypothetical protein V4473_01900 [Patescibacteria group bacterium]
MNWIKFIRIFLLVLIVIGVGLLITQKMRVPKLVDRILKNENKGQQISNINADSTLIPSFKFISIKPDEILELGKSYKIQLTPCIEKNNPDMRLSLWVDQDTGRAYDTGVDLNNTACDSNSHVSTIQWTADEPNFFGPNKYEPLKSKFTLRRAIGKGNNENEVAIATSTTFFLAGPSWIGEAGDTISEERIKVKISGSTFYPGDTIPITWISNTILGRYYEHFDISLMPLGVVGNVPKNPIVSSITSGGISDAPPFNWVIPKTLPPGEYQIRIDQILYPECQINKNCNKYTRYRQYTDGKAVYVKKFLESYYGISDSFTVSY